MIRLSPKDFLQEVRSFLRIGVVREPAEVADAIDRFLDGAAGEYDWDDFTSVPVRDRELNRLLKVVGDVNKAFPPSADGEFCSAEGVRWLRSVAKDLREGRLP
jgi:hypothetical protein